MGIGEIIVLLGVILVSMTLHEAMHGYVAYWLGDDTAEREGRLTLNPLRHIDPIMTILLPIFLALMNGPIFGAAKPVPFNPSRVRYGEWGAALVALAGPVINLVLAFICFGLWAVFGQSTDTVGNALLLGTGVNLGFFIFNMIPIPPLDGSRVMYALAPDFVRRGMEGVERYGIVVVFAIVLLAGPVLYAFMGSAINFFLHIFMIIFRLHG